MVGLVLERKFLRGVQKVYRFDNDFGASVVKHPYSLGGKEDLWELDVISWDGYEFDICYSTPIADDVIGFLSDKEVECLLKRIEALDKKRGNKMKVSKKLYSPQSYLELVTGKCYIINGDDDFETIRDILYETGFNDICDYRLDKIAEVVESDMDVVLVDCMFYSNKKKEFDHELIWFQTGVKQ